MLFYVGKDLARWIEQCLEFVGHLPQSVASRITYQSFADLLVQGAPEAVQAKLKKWGVADYQSIFTRALGLFAMFADAPPREMLSDEFVRHYYRYADQAFTVRQGQNPFQTLSANEFSFELYSSGEYSRILERSWGSE